MGESLINRQFSIAMLKYRRVNVVIYCLLAIKSGEIMGIYICLYIYMYIYICIYIYVYIIIYYT